MFENNNINKNLDTIKKKVRNKSLEKFAKNYNYNEFNHLNISYNSQKIINSINHKIINNNSFKQNKNISLNLIQNKSDVQDNISNKYNDNIPEYPNIKNYIKGFNYYADIHNYLFNKNIAKTDKNLYPSFISKIKDNRKRDNKKRFP